MHPATTARLLRDLRSVDGWMLAEAAYLFALIDDVQEQSQVRGDLFEIGVHHGKSAAVLAAMAGRDETLGVCDLFGDQELNVSGSGLGDRAMFDRTMSDFAPGADLVVFRKESSELTVREIGTNHRFFHIDGGHLAHETLADLRLAAATSVESGVIAIDDAFFDVWPGVTEATVRFLLEDDAWAPVVLGFSKLLIARRAAASTYTQALDQAETRVRYGLVAPWEYGSREFMGTDMRLFSWPDRLVRRSVFRAWVERTYACTPWLHSPVVAPLRSAARRLLR